MSRSHDSPLKRPGRFPPTLVINAENRDVHFLDNSRPTRVAGMDAKLDDRILAVGAPPRVESQLPKNERRDVYDPYE